jgi:hypothetical protein
MASRRQKSLQGILLIRQVEFCELLPISSLETTSQLDEFSRIVLSETDLTLSKYNCFKTILVKFEVMFIPFFKRTSLNLEADHLLHSLN